MGKFNLLILFFDNNMNYLKSFIAFLLGLYPFCSLAQPYMPAVQAVYPKVKILDTAYLQVRYKMSFWDERHEARYEDERVVNIGEMYRHDYSLVLSLHEDSCMKMVAEGAEAIPNIREGVYPMELYIKKNEELSTVVRTISERIILCYKEEPADFSWKLLPETDSVLWYPCQKAQTEYRGRVYDAWYCVSMPVDAGPYKFCGLPGLILKVADTAGDYCWEAVGIEKGAWPICEKKFVMQECTREQASKLIAGMFSNPYHFMVRVAGMRMMVPDKSAPRGWREVDEREMKVKNYYYYDPIERE